TRDRAVAGFDEPDAVQRGLLARAGPAAHLDAGEAIDAFDDQITGAGIEPQRLDAVRIDVERAFGVEFAVVGVGGERRACGGRDKGGGQQYVTGHGASWVRGRAQNVHGMHARGSGFKRGGAGIEAGASSSSSRKAGEKEECSHLAEAAQLSKPLAKIESNASGGRSSPWKMPSGA